MDTYYLVRSLVQYFGESLMVSLLLYRYLLTNLFDFFFWEKLIYLTWSHAGQQEHIFENTGKDKHTKGRRMQNFIWLWGEDFEYVWTLTEKIQKTKKNHLVAEKTMGENGKEMYRAIHQTVCWIKSGTLSFSSDQLLSPSPQLQTWYCISSCLNYHRISGFRMQNWRR